MRTTPFALLALAVVAGAPSRAPAWATEHVGNNPLPPGWGGLVRADALAAVNTPERVYCYEVNGNPTFYFRGDTAALDRAVRRFAALPDDRREVVLLAGPGEWQTLDGKTRGEFDWSVHVPAGLRFASDPDVGDTRMTLVIHIPAARPKPVADSPAVRQALADLDSPDFRTRERATNDLRALGPGTAPLLRAALTAATSAEVRARLDNLLAAYRAPQLDLLTVPAGVPVIGVDELVARGRKGVASPRADVRGYAIYVMAQPTAATADVLPSLVELLRAEKDEYALRCAAGVLSRMGAAAKPAVPVLRDRAAGQTGLVRDALQQAADRIDAAKPAAESAAAAQATIRDDIRAFVKARAGKGR